MTLGTSMLILDSYFGPVQRRCSYSTCFDGSIKAGDQLHDAGLMPFLVEEVGRQEALEMAVDQLSVARLCSNWPQRP